MPNMQQIIRKQNKTIIRKNTTQEETEKKFNCRIKNACPLNGDCRKSSIIYQAAVTRLDNQDTKTYIGLTDNEFKTRFRNHTSSFRNNSKRAQTKLSQYIWNLKDEDIPYEIKWKILGKASAYSPARTYPQCKRHQRQGNIVALDLL